MQASGVLGISNDSKNQQGKVSPKSVLKVMTASR